MTSSLISDRHSSLDTFEPEARLRYLAFPLSVLLLTAHVHAEEFVFHHENVLGTSAALRIHATSRSIADAAEEQILAQIDRCASVLSTYDPNSEVSRWIAGDIGTKVSSELYDVLALCEHFESQSDGAFNPRVGTATALWRRAAAEGKLPDGNELRIAAQRASEPAWRLDAEARSAVILEPGTKSLTFDAVAKGYIVDRVTEDALKLPGVGGVV